MKQKFFILQLLVCSAAIYSQTVKINPDFYRHSPVIPGYKLIFQDEFNTLNTEYWDLSAPGNDGPPYNDPDFITKSSQAPANPSNVLKPTEGILKISARRGEERDMADFSAGEIKTFNNHSWANYPPPYRNWTMIPGQYLEARVKIPYCTGINAALWLYGITGTPDDPNRRFFEVDVLESFSEKPSSFWSNLHYGKAYRDKTHKSKGREIKVKDQENKKLVLKDLWLSFGLEYTENVVKMYLNGQLYNTYKLYPESTRKSRRYLKSLPAFIRLGTGKASIERAMPTDCNDYPVFLEIDYIRLFSKDSLPAVHFLHDYTNISLSATKGRENSGFTMQVNYIPGVKYHIRENNLFEISPNPNHLTSCQCMQWWVSPKTNAGKGPTRLQVISELPEGRQETLELDIQIVE